MTMETLAIALLPIFFLDLSSLYNNDGVVKGIVRRRRLGFFRSAISLYLKSSSFTLHKTKTRALLESPMAAFRLHQPSIRSPAAATMILVFELLGIKLPRLLRRQLAFRV